MKAIQVSQVGGADVLKYIDVEKPLAPREGTLDAYQSLCPMTRLPLGEILVRNHFAGVNYIDTYHRTGLYPMPVPFIPGRYVPTINQRI